MDVLSPAGATRSAAGSGRVSLSVVVPAYNEEPVLRDFQRRLAAVLDTIDADAEIIYVNDGSRDGSMALLAELHRADDRVAVIDLSRNFGKEVAMSAGTRRGERRCGRRHRRRSAGSARADSGHAPRLAGRCTTSC